MANELYTLEGYFFLSLRDVLVGKLSEEEYKISAPVKVWLCWKPGCM